MTGTLSKEPSMPDLTKDPEARKVFIYKLRQDVADLDHAAAILQERGANRVATEVRKRVVEWSAQADEMERRA